MRLITQLALLSCLAGSCLARIEAQEPVNAPSPNRTSVGDTQVDPVVDWLARNAVRLRTVDRGNGFDDMEPLRAIVGNARVVALGEGSHGTHEIFAWKTRMVEFLVTQMGFTVFAREMVMPEAFDINDYVMTGRGDPGKALAATYNWPGNSEEVLDMIRWMRTYNADPKHSQKVKFYGFDLGYEGRALRTSLDYLREVDAEQARAFSRSLALLADPFLAEHFSSLPKSQTESLLPVAQRLLARLDEQREAYSRRTSPERWGLARQHAQILVQWLLAGQGRGDRMSRDHFMADNAAWILEREGPNAKVILSAHNGHVGCGPREV